MLKFEVQYKGHICIDAETRDEAVKMFNDMFPSPSIQPTDFYNYENDNDDDLSGSNDVIGFCEDCELPIFEDQSFGKDSEGVMWHKSCCPDHEC